MFINRVSQWADQLHASSSVPDHDRDPARFVLDASKPSKFVTFELVAYHLYGEKFNDEVRMEDCSFRVMEFGTAVKISC